MRGSGSCCPNLGMTSRMNRVALDSVRASVEHIYVRTHLPITLFCLCLCSRHADTQNSPIQEFKTPSRHRRRSKVEHEQRQATRPRSGRDLGKSYGFAGIKYTALCSVVRWSWVSMQIRTSLGRSLIYRAVPDSFSGQWPGE